MCISNLGLSQSNQIDWQDHSWQQEPGKRERSGTGLTFDLAQRPDPLPVLSGRDARSWSLRTLPVLVLTASICLRPWFWRGLSLLINVHTERLPGMALFLLFTANNSLVKMEVESILVSAPFVKSY